MAKKIAYVLLHRKISEKIVTKQLGDRVDVVQLREKVNKVAASDSVIKHLEQRIETVQLREKLEIAASDNAIQQGGYAITSAALVAMTNDINTKIDQNILCGEQKVINVLLVSSSATKSTVLDKNVNEFAINSEKIIPLCRNKKLEKIHDISIILFIEANLGFSGTTNTVMADFVNKLEAIDFSKGMKLNVIRNPAYFIDASVSEVSLQVSAGAAATYPLDVFSTPEAKVRTITTQTPERRSLKMVAHNDSNNMAANPCYSTPQKDKKISNYEITSSCRLSFRTSLAKILLAKLNQSQPLKDEAQTLYTRPRLSSL